MFKSPSMPIGTNDFTLEYFGNLYGAISSNTPLIFNANAPYAYSKGCLLIYGTSQIAVRWIIFEKPSSGDLLLDSIDLKAGAQESILHLALTRKGTTVKVYINGELKATKEQSAVKDLGDFRLGMANSSNMVMSRIYNYALSAEEVAAHYNDGDPAGYILPQNLKNIKDVGFTPKTFEFDMDSRYYQRILESNELESGRRYWVDYVVEEWDIAPAVMVTCGISCGVKAVAGNQYWNNLSEAKLGENQYVVVDTKKNRHSVYVCLRIGPCIPTYFPPVESNGSLCQDARLHRRVPAAEPNTYRRRFRCPVARLGAPASRSEWHPPAAGCFGRRV